jgi:hypothetical protein
VLWVHEAAGSNPASPTYVVISGIAGTDCCPSQAMTARTAAVAVVGEPGAAVLSERGERVVD